MVHTRIYKLADKCHARMMVGGPERALHAVAEAMYGSPIMVPVCDIDSRDYFLLVGTNPAVSAWNWVG